MKAEKLRSTSDSNNKYAETSIDALFQPESDGPTAPFVLRLEMLP